MDDNQTNVNTVPDQKSEAFYGEEDKSVVEDLLGTPTPAEELPTAEIISVETPVEAPVVQSVEAPVVQSVEAPAVVAVVPKKRGRKPKSAQVVGVPTGAIATPALNPTAPVSNEPAPAKKRGRKLGTIMPKKSKIKKIKPAAKRGRPAAAGKATKVRKAKKTKAAKAAKVTAPKTKGLLRSIKGGMKLVNSGLSKLEGALAKLAKI